MVRQIGSKTASRRSTGRKLHTSVNCKTAADEDLSARNPINPGFGNFRIPELRMPLHRPHD